MRMLALDTSGPSQSVAVFQDGTLLQENFERKPSSHSETLLGSIQNLLAGFGWTLREVDLFAVTAGPGSFTGLRIGLSTVKGFCRAFGKPAVAVSTLEALASPRLKVETTVIACLDARCGEIYAGAYRSEAGRAEAVVPDRALAAESLALELEKISGSKLLIGNAVEIYAKLWSGLPQTELGEALDWSEVHAAVVGKIGWEQFQSGKALLGEALHPYYLRASEAENRLQRKLPK